MTTRKWGTEQLVNTTTSGSQNDPTITALKGGGFVVAWVDDGVADSRVRYQLYDETGRRIGVEGTTGGSGDQTQPVVTPLDNGGFWIINRDFGTSATDQNLEGYVYAADGVTGAFRDPAVGVGDNPTGAAAAALGSGGFGIVGNVVVWTDLTLNNGDIRMRGFTPGGVSLFNTLTANSTVAGIQDQAAVAASNLDLDPLIAVVWRNADLNSGDIRARIFNEFGVQTTAEFSVADVVAGSQSDPQVVWLNADTFVVVWTNTGNSIQARRFRFDGLPLEDQFTVADPGTGQRGKAVVAALPGGGFVVAFEDTSSLPPENGNGVRLVTFDSSGRPVGPDIVVNTTTSNFQGAPAITALADGRIAVAWTDASATGGDASSRAIRMQIVDPRDGVVVGRNDGADAGLYGHDLVGDSIYGTAFGNRLYGLNGDDLLFGDGGADTLRGGRGDDELTGGAGNDILDGDDGGRRFVAGQGVVFEAQGRDTAVFAANFAQADLKFLGHAISVSTPGEGVDTVQRVELFQFADRTIARDAQDGVDDVYYYAVNPDVLASGLDADAHYWGVGRFEGRNPNSLFDRAYYLQNNPDVAAAGLEPYSHYLGNGWREGRNPSAAFNTNAYLQANPDVAASGENPLLHYLRIGADRGGAGQVGFDAVFYLASNPDVAAARIDPFLHYQLSGRAQNRDPSALFDADGYLATYGDVAAAGLDPLSHYLTAGWRENRDPSTGFDTSAYLTAWGDVAAAGVNPLFHYLVAGQFEGRYPINDGVWG